MPGLGGACRLYITSTAKMKPAFLKQTLLFPAGLMLRGFDFRLSSKIQKISSPFLTSPVSKSVSSQFKNTLEQESEDGTLSIS